MISWDKNNIGFVINDVVQFTKEILPKYFRHSNFSSFVRQVIIFILMTFLLFS
jgi:heat shock transcription factor